MEAMVKWNLTFHFRKDLISQLKIDLNAYWRYNLSKEYYTYFSKSSSFANGW